MLAAQRDKERIPVAPNDPKIKLFDIETIWKTGNEPPPPEADPKDMPFSITSCLPWGRPRE